LQIGDLTALGGRVTARMEFLAGRKEVYIYSPPPKPVGNQDLSGHDSARGTPRSELSSIQSGDPRDYPGEEVLKSEKAFAEEGMEARSSSRQSGVVVAGGHAVLEEGVWRRVRDSVHARPVDNETWDSLLVSPRGGGPKTARVYDVDVERHRLSIFSPPAPGSLRVLEKESTPRLIFADFSEVDSDHSLVERFEQELLQALQQNTRQASNGGSSSQELIEV